MNRRTLLKALSVPAAFAASGGSWYAWAQDRNPYYSGPVSDHFDGLRFFVPGHPWAKSPLEAFRALFLGSREPWPEDFPSPFAGAKPPARVAGSSLRVTLIGHASFLIQTSGLNVLTDPVFAERASPVSFAGPKRANPPGIAFDDLPKIDAVLVTHNHYDHLDLRALSALARRDSPRIITPLGNDALMRDADPAIRAEAHDWDDRVPLSDTVAVHLEPCLHWSARGVTDRRKALWAAFVIEAPGGPIYHIGDTGFGDGTLFPRMQEKHGAFRLAHIPIGAYEPRWFMKDQHINPDEAARIFQAVGAAHAIGHHWGTFRLTAEGVERPPEALDLALTKHGIAAERFRAFRPGEAWDVPPISAFA